MSFFKAPKRVDRRARRMNAQIYLLDRRGCIVAGIPHLNEHDPPLAFWDVFSAEYRESIKAAVGVAVVAQQGGQLHALDNERQQVSLELHPVPSESVAVCAVCEIRDRRIDALSERQREVCRLLGQGFTIGEIRKRMNLVRSTVDGHRNRAIKSLKMDSASFMVWCVENRQRL